MALPEAASPRIEHLARVQQALLAWHGEHGLQAPWRTSRDPYHALVAAVMAQQTQMSRVLPSYGRFMAAFPTLESLAGASPGDVIRAWAGMGYNQRAVRLHRAARQIANGGWPRDTAGLKRIDGVGPFTAAIIASFAFDAPAACVDTNVRRVLGRLAGAEGLDDGRLQALADTSLAADSPARWNQALMDYGARICTVRPKCGECVVAEWCAELTQRAEPLRRVAEEPAPYGSLRPKRASKRKTPFAGSARYYRGRIIDALRALPSGQTLPLAALPALLADAGAVPEEGPVGDLVLALERAGLARLSDGRVSLPE